MQTNTLTVEELREILSAAADVVFSDGVSDAFLDQWASETQFLLVNQPARSNL